MNWSRRQAIRTTATGLGLALAGGLVHFLQRINVSSFPAVKRPYARLAGLLRPPGALPEPDFLAACIRCYKCQDACEPGAIQFYTEKHGQLYHTPYVNPARAGCTLCMKCGPACPTGALRLLDEPRQADMGSVELIEDLCLSFKAKHLRSRQALLMELNQAPTEVDALAERRGPCGECFMFCPLRNQAIKLEPGAFLAPVIFPEQCVGCGMCEHICRIVVRGEPAIRVVRTRRQAGAVRARPSGVEVTA
ncbi:MAG: 4Fe-4S dicluster domain-containing protein [Phycisphaerae bacterium]